MPVPTQEAFLLLITDRERGAQRFYIHTEQQISLPAGQEAECMLSVVADTHAAARKAILVLLLSAFSSERIG